MFLHQFRWNIFTLSILLLQELTFIQSQVDKESLQWYFEDSFFAVEETWEQELRIASFAGLGLRS